MNHPIPFADLSPAQQACIRRLHHPGLSWVWDAPSDPALPASVMPVSDPQAWLMFLASNPRAAQTMRAVVLIPEALETQS